MPDNWKLWGDNGVIPWDDRDKPAAPPDRCTVCGRRVRRGVAVCSPECAESASEISSGA